MERRKHEWRQLSTQELETIHLRKHHKATFLDWWVLGPNEGVRHSVEYGWENFDRDLDNLWGPMPGAITNVDEAKAYVTVLYRMKED